MNPPLGGGTQNIGVWEVWMEPNFYTQKSPIRLTLDPKQVQKLRM